MNNSRIEDFAKTIEEHYLSLVIPVIKRASEQLAQEICANLETIKQAVSNNE